MSKAAPTNTDVIKAVMTVSSDLATLKSEVEVQHREKMAELVSLTEQVKYTNGRVRALELTAEKTQAVEDYKKSLPVAPTVRVNNNFQWDWKTIASAIAIILVALYSLFVQAGAN